VQAYNGLQRERLGDLQRARIISAMFDVATQRGVGSVTVAHVVERSGVSRRTFYEHFSDREDCFLAAFEQALAYASERVLGAYGSESGWRERVRAGLIALLGFLDEEPVVGRLLVCESAGGGPATLERRGRVLAQLRSTIQEGSSEARMGFASSPLAAEGILGGVLAVIQARIAGEPHTPLVELTNPLMSMIVLPYLGPAAARRELQRATPRPSTQATERTLLSDPFKDAGMRLTYRTVRVLMAIAEHRGASNRLIADTAEIKDQGQVSKLLARLQRAGMVTNTGLGPGQGAPNAWALTDRGRLIADGIRTHAGTPSGAQAPQRGGQHPEGRTQRAQGKQAGARTEGRATAGSQR
jgi:AcrR family transcriptional regulator